MTEYDDPTLALLLLQPVDLGDVTQAFAFEGCGESGAGRGLSLRSAPCSTTDYSGGGDGESDEFEHSGSDGGSGDTGGGDNSVGADAGGQDAGGHDAGGQDTGEPLILTPEELESGLTVTAPPRPQSPLDPNPFPLTPPLQQTSAPPRPQPPRIRASARSLIRATPARASRCRRGISGRSERRLQPKARSWVGGPMRELLRFTSLTGALKYRIGYTVTQAR